MITKNFFLGLDVGGTKVEAVLLQLAEGSSPKNLQVNKQSYQILERSRIPTQRSKGYEFVLGEITTLIVSICDSQSITPSDLGGIGVGLPGSITPAISIMINGNSQIFIGKNVQEDLKNSLGFQGKIHIDNDANLFALAETFWGAGLVHEKATGIEPKNQTSIGIILGTGCGGGMIIDGKQLRGRNGGGAEVGHSVLVKNGVDCYCGRKGCAEQYLSGTGLELMFERMTSGKKKSGVQIFSEAGSDADCRSVLDAYQEHLSLFLVKLTNIFDPDYIVLGGGVSNQKSLYQPSNAAIKSQSFIIDSSTQIYQNTLGDSAGVLGAALLPICAS